MFKDTGTHIEVDGRVSVAISVDMADRMPAAAGLGCGVCG